MTYNEDRITGGNQAFLFIKFFGDGYSFISGAFSDSLDKDSPAVSGYRYTNATVPSGAKYTQVGIGYYKMQTMVLASTLMIWFHTLVTLKLLLMLTQLTSKDLAKKAWLNG